MYRTKQTVDKHVTNILARVKDDKERNSKGYQIAKLYYEVNEYELSKRYLSGFLSVNENFAPAHRLLAQILEHLQRTHDAVESYKRSFDLDDRQPDVLLKICELYCQTDIDPERAKYWAEKAEKYFPKNDIVFKLREKIYSKSDVENKDEELENLIASELVKRPDDPVLRAKLLHLYIDTGRVNEAYEHAIEVEKRGVYPNSLEWYQALADVFQVYQEEGGNGHPNFIENLLSVQCALVRLHMESGKVSDCAEELYKFDQTLKTASKQVSTDERFTTFLNEMQAQWYYHAATLLLKRAQQDHLSWADAYAMAGACYMMSYATPPFSMQLPWVVRAQGDDKRVLTMLRSLACVRASITGHMLQNLNDWDSHRWRQKVKENYLTHLGLNKIFDALFTLRQMKQSKDSSYMLNNDKYIMCDSNHPTDSELREFDIESHMYMGDSLHCLVWLALQRYSVKDATQPMYGFHVFDDLQYNTCNLESAAPETLSQLDTEAFLYAVVRCSAVRLEERSRVAASPCGQSYLPPVLLETLVTKEQSEWWTAAYTLYKNQAKDQLAKLRLKLQRGLETVRLVANHGIKPALLVHLAKTFEERMAAVKAKGQGPLDFASDAADLTMRAAHYWKEAVTLLERTRQNQGMPSPKVVLFQLDKWIMEDTEMDVAIEEGKFFLACEAMHAGSYEDAIEAFEKLQSSEASYNIAQIYRQLAEDDLVCASEGDDLREEDREHYHALLVKARDALYVTLDKIRGNKHHKLTPQLAPEIDEIESKLNALAAGNSPASADGSYSTSPRISPYKPKALAAVTHSTPAKPLNFSLIETPGRPSPRLQPSPERLDAQMRSMSYTQDVLMKHLLDRNEELRAQNVSLVDEMRQNREQLAALKEKVEGLEAAQLAASARPSVSSSGPTSAVSTPKHGPPLPRPPPPEMAPHMFPGLPGHPPPHAYYPYPPPPTEFDYGAYYPQPMYPHIPFGYGSPAAIHHPVASMYKPAAAPVPPQPQPQPQPQSQPQPQRMNMVANGLSQDDDDDFYTYDDNEFDENAKADMCQTGRSLAGDRPLVQDWPFGNAVALEGQSTVTYSPSQPTLHQPGIFNQIPQPGAQSLMFPASGPPMPGPGFFSSPDRVANGFNQQYPVSGAPLNLHGSPLTSLQAHKPGFFSSTTAAANTHMVPSSAKFVVAQNALAGTTLYKAAEPSPVVVPTAIHNIVPTASSQVPTSPVSPSSKPATSFPITFSSLPTPGGVMPSRLPLCVEDQLEYEEDDDGLEDSYQGPDFEPLIPLPDEVEVTTGEEGEKVVFNSRGKLYRFVDKQWKERGIGDIKILFNESSGVARIVMRREQVLKVCANHLIKQDMVLEFKSDMDTRVLTWKAVDFAEDAPVLEQFCIRFKEPEVGAHFKDRFMEVQKLAAKLTKPRTPKTDKKQEDLFAKYKPAAGSWTCNGCYVNNGADKTKCVACAGRKSGTQADAPTATPVATAQSSVFSTSADSVSVNSQGGTPASKPIGAVSGFGDQFKVKPGSWTCDVCYVNNEVAVTTCVACNTQKPGTVANKKPESLASTGSCAGFTFGRPAATAAPKPSAGFSMAPAITAPSTGYVFGSGTSSGFSSTPVTTATTGFPFGSSTVASSTRATTSSTTMSSGFQMSPAPATITTTTTTTGFHFGTTATTTASKSFSFAPTNPHLSSPSQTTCSVAATTSTTTTTTNSSFVVSAPSSSAFGTQPSASMGFKLAASSTTATPGTPASTTPLFSQASAATPATTASVISPPKFSFANKPVFGNPVSTASSGFAFGASTFPTTTNSTTPTEKPSTAGGNVFGGFTFSSKPIVTVKKDPVQDEAKAVEKQKEETKTDSGKSNIFAGFSFTTPTKDTTDGASGSKGTKSVSGTPTSKSAAASTTVFGNIKTGDIPTAPSFGSSPGSQTFASLVEGKSDKEAFSKTKDGKTFPRAGAPVFGVSTSSPAKDDQDDDKVEEFEPEVDFTPVVPLPELVEVKTGEEDEHCMFAERAKLFRYDAETSQWKERGVGEMKILCHKESGRPRILMRRQQVLKLCANHAITADMKLNPLETSERAWCWLAQDYADDEMKNEQLAVRFKTDNQAASFHDVFVACQDKLRADDAAADGTKATTASDGKSKNKNTSGLKKANQAAAGWGEQFKSKPGAWECPGCYVNNTADISKCPACNTTKPGSGVDATQSPASAADVPTSSWGEQFKSKPGAWECPGCYISNTADVSKCPACNTTKPGAGVDAAQSATAAAGAPKSSWGDKFKSKPGEWECSGCYVKNQANVIKCPACNSLKPGASASDVPVSAATSSGFGSFGSAVTPPAAVAGFVFGRSTTDSAPAPAGSSGFTFGRPVSNTSTESSAAAASGFTFNKPVSLDVGTPAKGTDKPSSAFTFGSATSSSGFTFTPSTPKTDTYAGSAKSPKTPTSPDGSDLYQNNEGDDDHIYFEPLVSLPKVDVKTGEENEEVLYSHRAKLYRFSNGEWRERGLGDVKLLQDKSTKKVRLLMRRDQILKICLNHIVSPDLELKPMPNADGKAWTWHAEDYSEAEATHEKFAMRFRSADIANDFKQAFEDGQEMNVKSGSPVKADKKKGDKKKAEKNENRRSLDTFSFRKPSDSQASSPAAGTIFGSPSSGGATSTFGTSRGFTLGQADSATASQTSAQSLKEAPESPCSRGRGLLESLLKETSQKDAAEEEDVIVVGEDMPTPGRVCRAKDHQLPGHFYNYEKADPCPGCLGCDDEEHNHDVMFVEEVLPSPDKVALAEKFMLPRHFYNYELAPPCPGCIGCDEEDLAARPTMATGVVKSSEGVISATVTPVCGDHGNPYYAAELDKAASVEGLIKPTVTPVCGGDDGNPYYAKELSQAASVEGLIKPTVTLVCGGDDGNPYYAKELSQGVAQGPEDSISATVANVCGDRGNPYYAAELQKGVAQGPEDSISATVANVCGDRGNPYYAAELQKGVAQGPEDSISAAVANVCGDRGNPYYAAELQKGVAQGPEDSISATVANVCGDRGNPYYAAELQKGGSEAVISATVSEVCGDKGNPNYAAELNKGALEDAEDLVSATVANVCGDRGNPSYATDLEKGGSETVISATFSEVCGDKGNPNYAAELNKAASEAVISATVSEVCGDKGNPNYAAKLNKGALEDAENLVSAYVAEVCWNPGKLSYAEVLKKGLVGSSEVVINPTVTPVCGERGNPHYAAELDKEGAKFSTVVSEADSTPSEGIVFGADPGFSFQSIASSSSEFAFGKNIDNKSFNWQGAGRSVFGSSPSTKGADDDDDTVEPSPDVHFEPLVSLPKVEVKTGEEEEEVLYSQRSKLFRFDGTQWKERGIGEMKLLRNPSTSHIRLLMRREQVLKTACNHRLTLDMEFKPMATSETSMCWHALDFTEGEPQHEQFALKFKNRDLSIAFKEKVEECQDLIRSLPLESGGAGDAASADVSAADTSAADTSTADTSAGDTSAADTSAADTTVDESHHYEEEEDYEDEDYQPIFQKRATMIYAGENNTWKTIGMGELIVTYDDDLNAYRISMNSDDGYMLCNHVICQEYRIQSNETKCFCEWTGKDFATNEPTKRTFRVRFSSKGAATEFRSVFHEGISLARDSDIWEVPDNAGEMEHPIKAGVAKDDLK